MSNPSPEVKVTKATPQGEPEEYFDRNKTAIPENPSILENEDDIIRQEPGKSEKMLLDIPSKDREEDDEDSSSDHSSITVSEQQSGYERKSNECTECCIDCISCFGLFESCCPSTGEGFITNLGVFCGNIMVGCCKC